LSSFKGTIRSETLNKQSGIAYKTRFYSQTNRTASGSNLSLKTPLNSKSRTLSYIPPSTRTLISLLKTSLDPTSYQPFPRILNTDIMNKEGFPTTLKDLNSTIKYREEIRGLIRLSNHFSGERIRVSQRMMIFKLLKRAIHLGAPLDKKELAINSNLGALNNYHNAPEV
jgi:hypothetical protein